MGLLKKLWTDAWVKIVGALAALIASAVGTYVAGWWPEIRAAASAVWEWFGSPLTLPAWLVLFLSICAVLVVLVLAIWIWSLLNPPTDRWDSYRQDEFLDLRWRWNYAHGEIYGLQAYCVACDYQMAAEDRGYYAAAPQTTFRCLNCAAIPRTVNQSWLALEDHIKRLIDRNVRTGDWRERLGKGQGVRGQSRN